jgi:hypothetical protein
MSIHRSSFFFDDNKLYVSREAWSDLTGDPSVVGLAGVVAAAREVIRHQGAFVLVGTGVDDILRCIDGAAEFDQFVQKANDARAELGLQRL